MLFPTRLFPGGKVSVAKPLQLILSQTGHFHNSCVINTAFDAANRDFRVVVPRDLTRGSEHLEEPALRMISLHLGLVVDSEALLGEWRSQKE